ncbi:MAG: 50S ribosomal protein L30 [Chloroflexi bacterium]|nr:50S ribosomal protein L30 [Chloroflexota bacterium]
MSGDKLIVTLIRSQIGYPLDQRATVKSLGLRRIRETVEIPDNEALRGMLHKIRHLVRVESTRPGLEQEAESRTPPLKDGDAEPVSGPGLEQEAESRTPPLKDGDADPVSEPGLEQEADSGKRPRRAARPRATSGGQTE